MGNKDCRTKKEKKKKKATPTSSSSAPIIKTIVPQPEVYTKKNYDKPQ